MKKLILLSFLVFYIQIAFGQNPNPWESIEKPSTQILTLSDGRYPEIFENDTLRKIGSIVFNTRTNKIEYFIETDTLYSESTLKPEVVSRWLSIDPLAHKFPSMSPYVGIGNNPILNIDVDGNIFVTYISVKVKDEATGKLKKVNYKVTFDGTTATMQVINSGKTEGDIMTYEQGTSQFVDDMITSYNYIVENNADIDDAMRQMAQSSEEIEIKNRAGAGEYSNGVIKIDFSNGLRVTSKDKTVDGIQSPALGFWSEVYHAYVDKIDLVKKAEFKATDNSQNDLEEEYIHVEKEGKVIDALKESNPEINEPKRTTYGDGWKNVKTKGPTSTEKK